MTEREIVLRERAAFVAGADAELKAWMQSLRVNYTTGFDSIAAAQAAYPLPRVTRPRVLRIDDKAWLNREWRYVSGSLQSRTVGRDMYAHEYPWVSTAQITPQRTVIEALADLIANPNETVEE